MERPTVKKYDELFLSLCIVVSSACTMLDVARCWVSGGKKWSAGAGVVLLPVLCKMTLDLANRTAVDCDRSTPTG